MYRLFVLGMLVLAGCQNVVGPFGPKQRPPLDDPLFNTMEEKQRRGRAVLALPDESRSVAPPTGFELPGSRGR